MTMVVESEDIRIDRHELGPFGTNAYILACRKTGVSLLIDAPARAKVILKELKGTHPQSILITHGHPDHVGALSEIKSALNVPVAAHAEDVSRIPVSADILLKDGDTVSFGALELKVMHTPGHTPGSLCFLIRDCLIAGDTLFPNGPGHTGSPTDFRQILESITRKLFVLPDQTRIFPGHGEATVLEAEKNAFNFFSAKTHDPMLCGDVVWQTP